MAARLARLVLSAAALGAAAVIVLPAGAQPRDTVLPTLYVEYTMNCTFGIVDDAGKRVAAISPGTYQIYVTSPVVFATVDLSGINDLTACKGFTQFELAGPGVNLFTTLQDGDEDKDVFKATFQPSSSYTARDLNQPSVARAVFATTATGTPTAPASPYTPSTSPSKPSASVDIIGSAIKTLPARGALSASVAPSGAVKLAYDGKAVGTLREGRYTATVTDRTPKSGFQLSLLGKGGKVAKTVTLTTPVFVGTRTSTVELKKGQWLFLSAGNGKKTYFIVTG